MASLPVSSTAPSPVLYGTALYAISKASPRSAWVRRRVAPAARALYTTTPRFRPSRLPSTSTARTVPPGTSTAWSTRSSPTATPATKTGANARWPRSKNRVRESSVAWSRTGTSRPCTSVPRTDPSRPGIFTAALSRVSKMTCPASPSWALRPSTSTRSLRPRATTATTRPITPRSTRFWEPSRTLRSYARRPRSSAFPSSWTASSTIRATTRSTLTATATIPASARGRARTPRGAMRLPSTRTARMTAGGA